ncbi:MAG TPA: hypothetical protein DCQ06_06065 [Myxococcales bacterium]|nr:hypothetical protein [Myxococcales bacterium]
MMRSADELFVIDRDNGTLVVMETTPVLKVKRTITVGKRPEHVLIAPNGDAWVSVRHEAKVVRIAKGAEQISQTIEVGVEPIGMAMNDDATSLFVAVTGEGAVKVIDLKSGALSSFAAGHTSTLRSVIVAHRVGKPDLVYVVDLHGGMTAFSEKSGVESVGQSPLRRRNPGHVIDQHSEPVELNAWRAVGGSIHPETNKPIVAHVLVGNKPQQPAHDLIHEDSSTTYGGGASGQCTTNTPLRPIEVTVSEFTPDSHPVSREFAVVDPDNQRLFLARFDQPSDVIHHPLLSLAFVPAYGTDNVLVLNTGAGDVMRFPIAELRVGAAPKAVVISADGNRAFVLNQHGFSVSEVDLKALTQIAVKSYPLHGMAPQTQVMTLSASNTLVFAADPMSALMQKGRRLFTHTSNEHISAANRFACASCHLEGSEDKLSWDVGDGPRQTPSLAGRLENTGPFNWAGTEPHLKGNMNDTIKRMGGNGLDDNDLDALEEFLVKGLPARPNPHRGEKLTAQQNRGRDLFFDTDVGCGGCHVGGEGSDGQNWNVGTVDKMEHAQAALSGKLKPGQKLRFNTPSLRGVWATAPYFHNGSAKTLRAALISTSTTMGKTSHLTSDQLDDLVAYLRTL